MALCRYGILTLLVLCAGLSACSMTERAHTTDSPAGIRQPASTRPEVAPATLTKADYVGLAWSAFLPHLPEEVLDGPPLNLSDGTAMVSSWPADCTPAPTPDQAPFFVSRRNFTLNRYTPRQEFDGIVVLYQNGSVACAAFTLRCMSGPNGCAYEALPSPDAAVAHAEELCNRTFAARGRTSTQVGLNAYRSDNGYPAASARPNHLYWWVDALTCNTRCITLDRVFLDPQTGMPLDNDCTS